MKLLCGDETSQEVVVPGGEDVAQMVVSLRAILNGQKRRRNSIFLVPKSAISVKLSVSPWAVWYTTTPACSMELLSPDSWDEPSSKTQTRIQRILSE